MDIPDCYGKGIYEYWKLKKDSIKILINGIAQKDSIFTAVGGILTGAFSIRDVYNFVKDKGEKTILPKDECNS